MGKKKDEFWQLRLYVAGLTPKSVTALNNIKKYHGGLGYTYNTSSKFKEPFKNLIKNNMEMHNINKEKNTK